MTRRWHPSHGPTAPVPTDREVERIRARRHVPWFDQDTCRVDGQKWPCDAARLLSLVDNQDVTLQEDQRYMRRQDARLTAVLDECDRMVSEYPYRRAEDLARIRAAATGDPTC